MATTLKQYMADRVMKMLGAGGYGTVVRAEDMYTSTLVAIKVLHSGDNVHEDVHLEEELYRRLVLGSSSSIQ